MPPGGRRSKIRPPRRSLISSSSSSENSTTDAVIDFDKNWSILSNAISQIQNKNVSNLSYEQLYRKAYVLVLRKFGGKLYDNVSESIKVHLLSRRRNLLGLSGNYEIFMSAIIQEWNEHLQSMNDVLMYLNRVYVKEQKKLLIYDLGIQLFNQYVIKYNDDEIGSKIIEIVIDEISKSRVGTVITSSMYITKIINMLELLVEPSGSSDVMYGDSYYQNVFEPRFLKSSEISFQDLSNEFISYNSGSKYLQLTSQFIKDEDNRVRFYLPPSTYPKLMELMNNIMIKDKIDKMILTSNQGLEHWLKPIMHNIFEETNIETYHYADLKMLYNLIGRFDDEYQLLRLRIKEGILKQGNALPEYVKASIENSASANGSASGGSSTKKSSSNSSAFATRWIEAILKYRDQLLLIWKESFDENLMVEQTLTFAMRDVINGSSNATKRGASNNTPTVNAPETLSIYMDYFIKQLTKGGSSSKDVSLKSVDQTEELITRSIQFLRFIKDKDTFEANYANHFAKRFLNSKNSNSSNSNKDVEEIILGKLSEEMGTSSLDKVIKMNRDIRSSRDTTTEWKKYLNKHQKIKTDLIELELKICNVTDWPKSMTKDYKWFSKKENEHTPFQWPKQLRSTIKEFEEFWSNGKKNDSKSLFWSPKFGSMDLRITYPSRTYEINMATYAAIIMLLFAPQSITSGDDDEAPISAFEENKQFTYLEIQELTGIPEMELKRHLQSIAVAPKSRLLIKIPMSREVKETDVFKLNEKFKAPSVKVKISTVASSSSVTPSNKSKKTEKEEEIEEVNANIKEGRRIEISAAIVRILKSRQTIKHNDLIEELIKQLSNRFQPSIILIKQIIEDLIDKEYLKRDETEKNVYTYIA
ncbi:LOW QUALITY PROTEIN: Cul3 Cullin-3 [Candida maltosa Xu316]